MILGNKCMSIFDHSIIEQNQGKVVLYLQKIHDLKCIVDNRITNLGYISKPLTSKWNFQNEILS
jgi:hypothetical protein